MSLILMRYKCKKVSDIRWIQEIGKTNKLIESERSSKQAIYKSIEFES